MSGSSVVLVTGAGGGIGASIAQVLAERGHTVVAADLKPSSEAQAEVHPVATDVTNDASVAAAIELALSLGSLRGVVNCAGLLVETPVADLDGQGNELMVAVNLLGAMRVVRLAVPHMEAGAAIVNITSIAAAGGSAHAVSGYAATKGGLEAYTRAMACELGPRGIRVNSLAPGIIRAPMAGLLLNSERGEERMVRQIPLGRLGEPTDIGRVVAFLLSEDAAYVHGTVVTVDGGVRAG